MYIYYKTYTISIFCNISRYSDRYLHICIYHIATFENLIYCAVYHDNFIPEYCWGQILHGLTWIRAYSVRNLILSYDSFRMDRELKVVACIFRVGSPEDLQPFDQFKTAFEPLALYLCPVSQLIEGKMNASTGSFGACKRCHFTSPRGHWNSEKNSLFTY